MRAARAAARGYADGNMARRKVFDYYARPRSRASSSPTNRSARAGMSQSPNHRSSRSGVLLLSPSRRASISRRPANPTPKPKCIPKGSATKRSRVVVRAVTARGQQALHQRDTDSRFPMPYPGVDHDRRQPRAFPLARAQQDQHYYQRRHQYQHPGERGSPKRGEDGHPGSRKVLSIDHIRGPAAAVSASKRRTRPRSAIVVPRSRTNVASDRVKQKAQFLSSTVNKEPAVDDRGREGRKIPRPTSAPSARGGHGHQVKTEGSNSDGGVLTALSRMADSSSYASRELRIMKWVVLRETYLTKLHGVVSADRKRAKSNAIASRIGQASNAGNAHRRRSPKLFALLTELLTVLRRITVEIVEAVERWRRGDKEKPFIWGSSNYLVKAAGDTEFLSRLPGLEEHLGVVVSHNPFLSHTGLDGRSAVLDRSSIRSRSGKFPLSASGSLGVSAERVAAAAAVLYREVRRARRRQQREEEANGGIRTRSDDSAQIGSLSFRRRRSISPSEQRSPADSARDSFAGDKRSSSTYDERPRRPLPSPDTAAGHCSHGRDRNLDSRDVLEHREHRHHEKQLEEEEEEERQRHHNNEDDSMRVSRVVRHECSTAPELAEVGRGQRHSQGPPRRSLPYNQAAGGVGARPPPPLSVEHHALDAGALQYKKRRATEVLCAHDNSGEGGRRRVSQQFNRRSSTGSRDSSYVQREPERPLASHRVGTANDDQESRALPPDDQSLDYQNGGVVYDDHYHYEQQEEGHAHILDNQSLDYYYQEGGYFAYAEDEHQRGYDAGDVAAVDDQCTGRGNPDDGQASNPNTSEQMCVDYPEDFPNDCGLPSPAAAPGNDEAADNTAPAQPPHGNPVEKQGDPQYELWSSESPAAEAAVGSTQDPPAVVEETKPSDDPDPQDGSHGRMGRRGSPFNLIFNMCDGMLTDLKDLGMGDRTYSVVDEAYELQPTTLGNLTELRDDNDDDDVPTAVTNGTGESQGEGAAYTPPAVKEVVATGGESGRPPPLLRGAIYASLTRSIVAVSKEEGPARKQGSFCGDRGDTENSIRALADSFSAWAEKTEGRLRRRDAKAARHYRLGRLRRAMSAWETHRSSFLGGRMAEAFAGRFGLSTRFFVGFAFDALRTHAKGARVATRNRAVIENFVSRTERFGKTRLRQAWRRWAPPKMGPEHWRPAHAEALRTLCGHWSRGRLRGALDTWRRRERRQHETGSEPTRPPLHVAGSFAGLKGKLKAAGSFASLKDAHTPNTSKPRRTAQASKSVGHQDKYSTTTGGEDEDSWAEWLGNEASTSGVSPGGEKGGLRAAPASSLVITTKKIGGDKNETVSRSPVLSPSRSFRGLGATLKSIKSFRDGRDKSQTQQPRLRPTASFGSPPRSSPSVSPTPPPPSSPNSAAANATMDVVDALQVRHFAANRTRLRGEAAKLQSRENAAATIQRALWRAPRERTIAARASNSASLIQSLWRLQSRRNRAGFRLVRAWRARIRARIATLDMALVEAAGEGDLRAVAFLLRPPAAMAIVGSGLGFGERVGAGANAVAVADRETALHAAAAGGGGRGGAERHHPPVTGTEHRVKDAAGAAVGLSGSSTSVLMVPAAESSDKTSRRPLDMDGYRSGSSHWLRRRGDTPDWVGVIQALVEAGAMVEARDQRGFTPMMTAAEKGSGETVAALATLGAEVDAKEVRGGRRTPLLIAAQKANAPAAAALLEYGARVNLTVGDSLTPLHEAVGAGSTAVAEMLVRAGANVNATNESAGMTPLHLAVANNQHAAARLLVHSGANVCLPDARGLTCLRLTIEMADAPTVALLLAAEPPADLSVRDENGGTVLHAACRLGLTDIAQLLLEHGADPHVRDARGRTPELVALDLGHGDCAGLFYNVDIHSYIPPKSGGDGGGRGDVSLNQRASGDGEEKKEIGEDNRFEENGHGGRGSGGSRSDEDGNETDEAQRAAAEITGHDEEGGQGRQYDEHPGRGEAEGEGARATENLREDFAKNVAAARRSSSVSMQAQDGARIEGSGAVGEYAQGADDAPYTEITRQKDQSENEGHGSGIVDAEDGTGWEWSETEGWILRTGSGSNDAAKTRSRSQGVPPEEYQDEGAAEAAADGYYNEPPQNAYWQQTYVSAEYGRVQAGSTTEHDESYDGPHQEHHNQQEYDSGQGRDVSYELTDIGSNSNTMDHRNSWEGYESGRGVELLQQESGEGGEYDSRELLEATLAEEWAPSGVEEEQQRQEGEVFASQDVDDANGGATRDEHDEDTTAAVTHDSNVDVNESDGVKDATVASIRGSLEGGTAIVGITSIDGSNRDSIGWGGTAAVAKARNRWISLLDRSSGSVYYQNERSGLTQWDVPADAIVVAPPQDG